MMNTLEVQNLISFFFFVLFVLFFVESVSAAIRGVKTGFFFLLIILGFSQF